MAHFALLWKARTIQKSKNNYEIEKLNTIISSKTPVDDAFSSQKLWRCKRRCFQVLRKVFPEGSNAYVLMKYLRTDQTFPNFVLKSVIGFVGGVVLTYLCFLFFVFQLSISLIHATIMSSVLGILLTLGLAFSYRVRCLVFLVIPQFFSRVGRYTLTCYALVLVLTGPATNSLRNSEILSECLASGQEQVKISVRDMNESFKNPYNAFKDNINILIARGKQTAEKVKDSILKIHRLALSIVSVIQSSFGWLSSTIKTCNKKLKSPYDHCAKALKEASLDCQAKHGPWKFWMCDVDYVTKQACQSKVALKSFCVKIDYVNEGLRNSLKKKLKAFFDRINSMLSLDVKVYRSYVMSSTAKPLNQSGSSGIVTEIRHRANPLLTWLSWSSCLTSASALIILFRAKYYQYMYETRSRYDNRYITNELRQLDLKRSRQGRETVLPLNRREKGKYIKPSSFRLLEPEKISLSRAIVFMVTTTFKLMIHIVADYSLYWVLKIIRHHGIRQAPLVLQSSNKIFVQGSKPVASILRVMIDSVSPDFMGFSPSLVVTLPDPYPPDFERYGQIGILIILLWFFTLFEPYGLRLRHIVMGLYRPERAKARAMWLYHHILRTRAGFMKYARRKLHREYKYTSEAKYTFRNWLNSHIPFKWFISDPTGRNCLLCNTVEYAWDAETTLVRCEMPNCPGTFCTRCFSDIGQLCTICMRPADYGDISDVSLEKGSSAESSDSENDSLISGRNKFAKFVHDKKKQYKKYLKKEKRVKEKQEEMFLLKSYEESTGTNEDTTYRNKANRVRHLRHLKYDLFENNNNNSVKKENFQIYCQDCEIKTKCCTQKLRNVSSGKVDEHTALISKTRNKSYGLFGDKDDKYSCHETCKVSSSRSEYKSTERINNFATYFVQKTQKFKRKIKRKRKSSIRTLGLSDISSSLTKRRRKKYLYKVRKRTRRNPNLQWLSRKAKEFMEIYSSTVLNSMGSNTDTTMIKRFRRRGQRNIKFKLLGIKMEFVVANQESNTHIGQTKQTPICCSYNNTNTTRSKKSSSGVMQNTNKNTAQKEDKDRKNNHEKNRNTTGKSDNHKMNLYATNQSKNNLELREINISKRKFKNPCSSYWNNTFKKSKKPEDNVPSDAVVNFKRRKKYRTNKTAAKKAEEKRKVECLREFKIDSFFADQEWVDPLSSSDLADLKGATAESSHEVERGNQTHPAEETNHAKKVWTVDESFGQSCSQTRTSDRYYGNEAENKLMHKLLRDGHSFVNERYVNDDYTRARLNLSDRVPDKRTTVQQQTQDSIREEIADPRRASDHRNVKRMINKMYSDTQSRGEGNEEITSRRMQTSDCRREEAGPSDHPRYGATTQSYTVCCESQDNQRRVQEYDDVKQEARKKWFHHLPGVRFFKSMFFMCNQCSSKQKQIEMPDRENRKTRKLNVSCVNRQIELKQKFTNFTIDQINVPDPINLECVDTGIDATVPTCTCATQYIGLSKDVSTEHKCKLVKEHKRDATTLHFNAGKVSLVAYDRSTLHFNCLQDTEEDSKIQRITKQTSTANKSDTSIYENARHTFKFSPGKIKIRQLPKEDKSTATITGSLRETSTTTSDWWSPMIESQEKAPLERKKGTYVMERKRQIKKLKNRGVWTEERVVRFRSQAQIIPPGLNTGSESNITPPKDDLLSPIRYLIESQKYYNELFTPLLFSNLSVLSVQKAEQSLLTRGVASEDNLSVICNYGSSLY